MLNILFMDKFKYYFVAGTVIVLLGFIFRLQEWITSLDEALPALGLFAQGYALYHLLTYRGR